MNQNTERTDCLIVGAGIAGLIAATTLREAGVRCCVLEKSRGLGGRMATRRRDGAVFDHGAQFMTVRDPRFRNWMERWVEGGLVAPWYELGEAGTHYRGVPGMTAIAKHLAEGLDIHREVRIEEVRREAGAWKLLTDTGQSYSGAALLLTAPVPQSLALLATGKVEIDAAALKQLRAILFRRCIVALAILDGPSNLSLHQGALKLPGEPVQWIGDNQRKGVSPDVPAVTIHSTPAFAEEYWDAEDSVRLPRLLEAAAPYLQAGIASCKGHRWGFSEPVTSFDREAFVDADRKLAIAGDGLTGGRVEGAALSGLAAARELAPLLATRSV